MHYYDFNIADYRKDTTHLTPIEHYIYRSLIDWYYLDESPIPNKTQWVLRRLSLSSENSVNLENVLSDFFELEENESKESFWHHSRISRDIEKYKANAQKNRENGAKGGRPKQNIEQDEEENPTETHSVSEENQTLSEINPNQELITNNQQPVTNNQVINIFSAKAEKISRSKPLSEVDEVFNYWREFLNHPNAKLNSKRDKAIRGAIKLGYTVSQLKQAVVGCSKSPFHMGANDNGEVYDDLPIIVRNIDKFIEKSERHQTAYPTSRQTERIEYQPSAFADLLGTNFDAIEGVAL